ncbi:MAG TPA: nodulation protein NfeD [Bryobacteraceae bacterium]|nr:nodulation protein NfeD [Bryobacteraceae bacterium]
MTLRLLVFFGCLVLAGRAQAAGRVLAVDVDSIVHPVTVEIVGRALDQAVREHDDLVLIRLNTPGGLMDAMRETIQKIVASPVSVVTYVAPSGGRAASAGFFLLEAGDVAAMAPGTNTGAAHPVLMGTEMDPVMKQKVENDAAASLRSLTSKRGRNSDLAQKAVLESKSFTEKEALDNHLIELIANNEQDLMRQLDGREITRFDGRKETLHVAGAEIVVYEKNLRQRVLSAISDPNIALILLVLGALGIYVEFSTPGVIFPGVAGAIMVLLGLSALSMLPINWLGAALLILSFAFFVLEAKFAAHGVLAAGGSVAMILGAVILINSPLPEMRIHLSTAIALALPFAAITVFLLSLVMRARAGKVVTGVEGMLGETGVALADLAPEGRVFVRGEYWNAVATAPVKTGEKVRVTAIDHLNLTVEPVQNQSRS